MATKDQVAQLIVGEAKARNHTRDECLGEMSCLYQESQWDETVWDATHTTYGVAQQDGSYPDRFNGAAAQVKAFFDRLDVKRTSPNHGDIWENLFWLQQGPNWPSAAYAVNNPKTRIGYMTEIKSRIATVTPYLNKYWPDNTGAQPMPAMPSPINRKMLGPNHYDGRNGATPRWICVHTQEGGRTAVDLAQFLINSKNTGNPVSYNTVNDDRDDIQCVEDVNGPWAASGANNFAFHICLAGSYSGWSRGKWLETDASDGKNEDAELSLAAKQIAKWCQEHNIPAEYIGGRGIPWGSDGICGHVDFGSWGGGHHDPGPNFPWDELIRRVKAFLGGAAPAPLPTPVPVGPGGGTPVDPNTSPYFTGVLYIGSEGPQVSELQRRLKAAYSSYAGQLPVDGDFGPLTDAAVRVFQGRSGLTVDGIVGAQTAAALKLKKV